MFRGAYVKWDSSTHNAPKWPPQNCPVPIIESQKGFLWSFCQRDFALFEDKWPLPRWPVVGGGHLGRGEGTIPPYVPTPNIQPLGGDFICPLYFVSKNPRWSSKLLLQTVFFLSKRKFMVPHSSVYIDVWQFEICGSQPPTKLFGSSLLITLMPVKCYHLKSPSINQRSKHKHPLGGPGWGSIPKSNILYPIPFGRMCGWFLEFEESRIGTLNVDQLPSCEDNLRKNQ